MVGGHSLLFIKKKSWVDGKPRKKNKPTKNQHKQVPVPTKYTRTKIGNSLKPTQTNPTKNPASHFFFSPKHVYPTLAFNVAPVAAAVRLPAKSASAALLTESIPASSAVLALPWGACRGGRGKNSLPG